MLVLLGEAVGGGLFVRQILVDGVPDCLPRVDAHPWREARHGNTDGVEVQTKARASGQVQETMYLE